MSEVMTDDEIVEALQMRVAEGRPTDGTYAPRSGLATPAVIDEAEQVIGYPLPPLLRRIYLEVANGGVGPFGGIEGLPGGYSKGGGMLAEYAAYLAADLDPDDPPAPPRGVLFICDYGCAAWVLLDCRHPQGRMWRWWEGNRSKLNLTLPEWLSGWLTDGSSDALWAPELALDDDESWYRPVNDNGHGHDEWP